MFEKIEFYNDTYGINDYMWILYDIAEQGIKVKRVLGTNPNITIPGSILDLDVAIIGEYCFAKNGHLSQEEESIISEKLNKDFGLCEICGENLHEIDLPDSVTTLESYAFYQCRDLKKLEVGPLLEIVHNDVFMNCRKLHSIVIREDALKKTGAKFLLSRLNLDVEVTFLYENIENSDEDVRLKVENVSDKSNAQKGHAKIFYPEYTESYEEIGPAHIFELCVEGEGYRARQSFQDGVVDLSKYDEIFEKSTNLENFDVLLQMALDRLMYPVDLGEEARNRYETFIEKNGHKILQYIVRHEHIEQLEYLGQLKLIHSKDYENAIKEAVSSNWTVGSAMLIRIAGRL